MEKIDTVQTRYSKVLDVLRGWSTDKIFTKPPISK